MASSSSPTPTSLSMATVFLFLASLVASAYSHHCDPDSFPITTMKVHFDSCLHLHALNSHLYYSYNATNASLSVGFVSTPAKPGGWVSWGINPKGEGMVGAQVFLAFKSNGTAIAKTFSLASYSNVKESKLSFDVWDVSVEAQNRTILIFGKLKLPEKADPIKVNHVWQVGPGTTADGKPNMHTMEEENLKSKGELVLAAVAPSRSPEPSGAAAMVIRGKKLGMHAGFLAILLGYLVF